MRALFLHPYWHSHMLSCSSALIYCPPVPLSPISPSFLLTTLCLFSPTTPSAIPPSIRLSNGHQGRESPCSCLGQTLITHTVTLGWGHSHPFCSMVSSGSAQPTVLSRPQQLQELKWFKWALPHSQGLKGGHIVLLTENCVPTVCASCSTALWDTESSRSGAVINNRLYLLYIDQFSSKPWLLQQWERLTPVSTFVLFVYWPILCSFAVSPTFTTLGASVNPWLNTGVHLKQSE